MKHFLKLLFGFVAIATLSCDSSSEKPLERGEDYIPLQKGWFQIYAVEEIVYSLGMPETLKYELRTVVADSFKNEEGRYTYVVYRSKRNEGETAWQPLDTWSIRINSREAVVNEENVPYVVLHFPLAEGKEWNGNAYNNNINPGTNKPEDFYRLETKGKPYTIHDKSFNDCLVVNQEDNQEFIVYFDKRTEVYSRGIGLIYKEKTQLNYCTDTQCIGQQRVENGVIYKQVIKEYGK